MINLSHAETREELQQQVWAAETAFAQTMADRDLSTFSAFLAPDTVFFSGNATHRGKDAVTKAWATFFEAEQAPFAWKPEQVEVLEDGSLAYSTGPVWNDQGQFAIYNSIWRRTDNGQWKIIFDKGNRYCPPPDKAQ